MVEICCVACSLIQILLLLHFYCNSLKKKYLCLMVYGVNNFLKMCAFFQWFFNTKMTIYNENNLEL